MGNCTSKSNKRQNSASGNKSSSPVSAVGDKSGTIDGKSYLEGGIPGNPQSPN